MTPGDRGGGIGSAVATTFRTIGLVHAEPDPSPIRAHTEVLAEQVAVAGRDVVDVGCGEGGLVRWLRSQGARVVGVECGAEMRRRAIDNDPDHADDYVDAGGEDLPFDDAGFDVVVYSYSLHHVPIARLGEALDEARRVLRPNGRLYVVEPAIDPPDRSVGHPVTDETEVRVATQAALDAAGAHGFRTVARLEYTSEGRYGSFEEWEHAVVGIDPDRRVAIDEHREHCREKFHRLGTRRDDGWVFRRTNLVRVLAPVA